MTRISRITKSGNSISWKFSFLPCVLAPLRLCVDLSISVPPVKSVVLPRLHKKAKRAGFPNSGRAVSALFGFGSAIPHAGLLPFLKCQRSSRPGPARRPLVGHQLFDHTPGKKTFKGKSIGKCKFYRKSRKDQQSRKSFLRPPWRNRLKAEDARPRTQQSTITADCRRSAFQKLKCVEGLSYNSRQWHTFNHALGQDHIGSCCGRDGRPLAGEECARPLHRDLFTADTGNHNDAPAASPRAPSPHYGLAECSPAALRA